jgi:hypothetical protein
MDSSEDDVICQNSGEAECKWLNFQVVSNEENRLLIFLQIREFYSTGWTKRQLTGQQNVH